jgi:hypothetical protein
MFGLREFTRAERRALLEAHALASSVERVTQTQLVPLPRGMREPGPGM